MKSKETNFTLRLTDAELEMLSAVQSECKLSTRSAAIRHIVNNFMGLNDRYVETYKTMTSLKKENDRIKKVANDCLSNLDSLKNLVSL